MFSQFNTPWKINGWNLRITHKKKGKWSEPSTSMRTWSMWVFPKMGVKPPKWMVKIMEVSLLKLLGPAVNLQGCKSLNLPNFNLPFSEGDWIPRVSQFNKQQKDVFRDRRVLTHQTSAKASSRFDLQPGSTGIQCAPNAASPSEWSQGLAIPNVGPLCEFPM